MEKLHVFVDEYGDPQLDTSKSGVSSTYIVTAFCVRESSLRSVAADAEVIREKLFPRGEMKSSSIGSKDGRRLHVIRDLVKLDGFVFAFCADKNAIDKSSGLAFKKSFIKFFANSLYQRITRCSDRLAISYDTHGGVEFQQELKRYLERRHGQQDLFSPNVTFEAVDSRQHVLLQVADIFAGSLARLVDPKKRATNCAELKTELARRVSITYWPAGRQAGSVPSEELINPEDENIRRYCIRRATDYLERRQNVQDRDELARVIFLDSLLAHHSLGEEGSFLSTASLKREIAVSLGEPIADHRFRSAVVAKLRDADVIISSCSKGYRLPTSVADMREFASFANSQIPPMVTRFAKANRGVREATFGRIEILSSPGLEELDAIVRSVEERKKAKNRAKTE